MSAYDILKARNVTRLCHFTPLRNLTHVLSSPNGILASDAIRSDEKNVTDTARYDGEPECVFTSIQYPNSWYLKKAIQRNPDKIFKDWVVIYIDLKILKQRKAKFSTSNASKKLGKYINDNMDEIESVFADSVPGFALPRPSRMLRCCPTDGQAEVLIKHNIPIEFITGFAVSDGELAARVYAMVKALDMEHIPIYAAPDVITQNWSEMVRTGREPSEKECFWTKEGELCLR